MTRGQQLKVWWKTVLQSRKGEAPRNASKGGGGQGQLEIMVWISRGRMGETQCRLHKERTGKQEGEGRKGKRKREH